MAGRHHHLSQLLLDAGAELVGKTAMDELAYSLNGENAHYGTPTNPRCPQRVPGGSSSGSAVCCMVAHEVFPAPALCFYSIGLCCYRWLWQMGTLTLASAATLLVCDTFTVHTFCT